MIIHYVLTEVFIPGFDITFNTQYATIKDKLN